MHGGPTKARIEISVPLKFPLRASLPSRRRIILRAGQIGCQPEPIFGKRPFFGPKIKSMRYLRTLTTSPHISSSASSLNVAFVSK